MVLQYVVGLPVAAEPALTIAERLDAALANLIPAWAPRRVEPQMNAATANVNPRLRCVAGVD